VADAAGLANQHHKGAMRPRRISHRGREILDDRGQGGGVRLITWPASAASTPTRQHCLMRALSSSLAAAAASAGGCQSRRDRLGCQLSGRTPRVVSALLHEHLVRACRFIC
jgi:hypothetical protein